MRCFQVNRYYNKPLLNILPDLRLDNFIVSFEIMATENTKEIIITFTITFVIKLTIYYAL